MGQVVPIMEGLGSVRCSAVSLGPTGRVEFTSMNQELQDMKVRARREHKKSPDEPNEVIQAEMQKVRVEMAAMKRDAEHYSCQLLLNAYQVAQADLIVLCSFITLAASLESFV
ncbi:hypothetical protein YC2023_081199 [Brassica napus]